MTLNSTSLNSTAPIPAAPNSTPPRLVSGKYVIIALLALGVAAGVGSWTYYARLQRRPLEFWGPDTARLIARAPQVEALLLESTLSGDESERHDQISVNGAKRVVVLQRDIALAPGISHIRQGLLHDKSFDWSETRDDPPPPWRYAVRFTDGLATTMLLLSRDCVWISAIDGDRTGLIERGQPQPISDRQVSIRPVAAEFESFLQEVFATPR